VSNNSKYEIPNEWTRERKISKLLSIAEALSKKFVANRSQNMLEQEDIYAIAATAIVKAVDLYDPNCGTKLTTYAMGKAKNAIKEEIRKNNHARRTMVERGESVSWISFNQTLMHEDQCMTLEDKLDKSIYYSTNIEDDIIKQNQVEIIQNLIEKLPKLERDVMFLYLQEMPMVKIAKELDIKDRNIYQIVKSAIKHMKTLNQNDNYLTNLNAWKMGYEL